MITSKIDQCDYFVLLVGGKYGTIMHETEARSARVKSGISWTHAEFLYARDRGIPILVFEAEGRSIDAGDVDAMNAFRSDYAGDGRLVRTWKNSNELLTFVRSSIGHASDEQSIEEQRLSILESCDRLVIVSYSGDGLEKEFQEAAERRLRRLMNEGVDLAERGGKEWKRVLLIHPTERLLQFHTRNGEVAPDLKSVFANFQVVTEKLANHCVEWVVRAVDGFLPFEGVFGTECVANTLGQVHVQSFLGEQLHPTSVVERKRWMQQFDHLCKVSKYSGKIVVWGSVIALPGDELRSDESVDVAGVLGESIWRRAQPLAAGRMRTIFLSLILVHWQKTRHERRKIYLQKRSDLNTGGDPGFHSLISSKLVDEDFRPFSGGYEQLRDGFLQNSTDANLDLLSTLIESEDWTHKLTDAHRKAALREIKMGLGLDPTDIDNLLKDEGADRYWIPRKVSTGNWQGLSIRFFSLELTSELYAHIDKARPGHGLVPLTRGDLDKFHKQGKECTTPEQCFDPVLHPLNHFLQLGYEKAIVPFMDRMGM